MADVLKRLVGPVSLTDTAATVYTVPSGKTATMLDMQVCNESGADAYWTLSIGTDGPGKRLIFESLVPVGKSVQRTGAINLDDGEVVQAYADVDAAITLTISGVEST